MVKFLEPVTVIPDFFISDDLFGIMSAQVTHNYPLFSNFGQYDFVYVINGTLIFILYYSLLKRFCFRIRYNRNTKKSLLFVGIEPSIYVISELGWLNGTQSTREK